MEPKRNRAGAMGGGSGTPARTLAVAYIGLTLSIVGAMLDLASGYMAAPMEAGMASAYLAETCLYVLGVVSLCLGVVSIVPSLMRKMRWTGVGMELLGVAMAVVSGAVPGMNVDFSYGMLVIGALMIINGALMQRWRPKKQEESR